jgi:hypothetical protein
VNDDEDGFDVWNSPKMSDPPLSTLQNLAQISESSNIVSESADTEKDSLPDLLAKHEAKTALLPTHSEII